MLFAVYVLSAAGFRFLILFIPMLLIQIDSPCRSFSLQTSLLPDRSPKPV